jgi:hypothetical protein
VSNHPSHLTLGDLVDHPERLADVDVASLPQILVTLTTATAAVAARLQNIPQDKVEDRLLDVTEAAAKLGRSVDWLYRHARTLPFTRRLHGMVKFSARGLQTYLDRLPRQ